MPRPQEEHHAIPVSLPQALFPEVPKPGLSQSGHGPLYEPDRKLHISERFPRKCISEEPTDTTTNIEDVPVEDSTMRIVMMNGFVYTIVHGAFVGSKPIVVSRINETSLEFQPSEIFKVLIVDFTGENYSTLYQHFDYKPMYRKEGKLQWDVELIMEYDNPLYWESDPLAITSIKYHNILRKKV